MLTSLAATKKRGKGKARADDDEDEKPRKKARKASKGSKGKGKVKKDKEGGLPLLEVLPVELVMEVRFLRCRLVLRLDLTFSLSADLLAPRLARSPHTQPGQSAVSPAPHRRVVDETLVERARAHQAASRMAVRGLRA